MASPVTATTHQRLFHRTPRSVVNTANSTTMTAITRPIERPRVAELDAPAVAGRVGAPPAGEAGEHGEDDAHDEQPAREDVAEVVERDDADLSRSTPGGADVPT